MTQTPGTSAAPRGNNAWAQLRRGGNRLSISVVSKRGRFPSLSYLVHDITDVDGDFGQPAQRHEALIFSAVKVSSGVFPTACSSDFADQLKVGRFYQWSHDFRRFQADL